MNLIKLFEAQRELDQHIIDSKPHLKEEDVLPRKILALQVELGELANEWRGFKFWKVDTEPRIADIRKIPQKMESGIHYMDEPFNPLLEEYVDCLHFVLSIGLSLCARDDHRGREPQERSITNQFLYLNKAVSGLYWNVEEQYSNNVKPLWQKVFTHFMYLGELLGFTADQIEQAYFDKNQVNHNRQESGY